MIPKFRMELFVNSPCYTCFLVFGTPLASILPLTVRVGARV
jgi:hypothetical protein